jgi:6,7-dimethyl-8-ribityllumazine synthase
MNHHILVIEARFYDHLADMALRGAKDALNTFYAKHDVITVPGCLEIPAVLQFAQDKYEAFVLLGTVIRGETSHFDFVCSETFRGITDVTLKHNLAVGNGIQTVETEEQAIARLDPEGKMNKGAAAVKAAMRMLQLKQNYGGAAHG